MASVFSLTSVSRDKTLMKAFSLLLDEDPNSLKQLEALLEERGIYVKALKVKEKGKEGLHARPPIPRSEDASAEDIQVVPVKKKSAVAVQAVPRAKMPSLPSATRPALPAQPPAVGAAPATAPRGVPRAHIRPDAAPAAPSAPLAPVAPVAVPASEPPPPPPPPPPSPPPQQQQQPPSLPPAVLVTPPVPRARSPPPTPPSPASLAAAGATEDGKLGGLTQEQLKRKRLREQSMLKMTKRLKAVEKRRAMRPNII